MGHSFHRPPTYPTHPTPSHAPFRHLFLRRRHPACRILASFSLPVQPNTTQRFFSCHCVVRPPFIRWMHTFVPLHLNRSTLLPSWTCLHPISRNGRRLIVNCFCPFFSYGSAAGCSRQPRLSASRGMFSLLRFFLAKCIKHFHFICYTSRNCLNHWPLWRGHDQPIPDTRHAEVSFGFSFKFFFCHLQCSFPFTFSLAGWTEGRQRESDWRDRGAHWAVHQLGGEATTWPLITGTEPTHSWLSASRGMFLCLVKFFFSHLH